MITENIFSSRLLECRKQHNLSQKALADLLGLTDAAVTMMEKGKRFPSYEIFLKLADCFNVSLDYLAGRTEIDLILNARNMEELALFIKIQDSKDDNTEVRQLLKRLSDERKKK